MRLLGKEEIENIAIGAALLGTGGGGDPYIGKLMALQAIEEHGPIRLISIDEVPDGGLIVPSAMMGAPTVMVEKIPNGDEAETAFKALEEYIGQEIYATMPIEAGGVNSLLPLALAAKLGLPVIDADGMGRAFPELQMVTFYLDGISASPMVLADEKGNNLVMNTINNKWAERIARSATIDMGGSVMLAIYPMTKEQVQETAILNSLSLEEKIGATVKQAKENEVAPVQAIIRLLDGFELFKGKIADINRATTEGFAKGTAKVIGVDDYLDETCLLHFQNEHLLATKGDEVLCVTPDLIAVLDTDTGTPITTEGIRYGARCTVIGIPANEKWRTEKGIETVGPAYFGYEVPYIEVEKLQKSKVI